MEIVLVAAVAENGVIGAGNTMPWRLKSDLQRFRARTMGKPVILGRKTFESIGSPLKGRTNIVVSRDRLFTAPGVAAVTSLESALETARADALRRGVSEIVIGGGSHIYAMFMPAATRLDITRVHATPSGDTYFPPIDADIWEEIERMEAPRSVDDTAGVSWLTYRRKDAPRLFDCGAR
jgi:dihydrofolate reductase